MFPLRLPSFTLRPAVFDLHGRRGAPPLVRRSPRGRRFWKVQLRVFRDRTVPNGPERSRRGCKGSPFQKMLCGARTALLRNKTVRAPHRCPNGFTSKQDRSGTARRGARTALLRTKTVRAPFGHRTGVGRSGTRAGGARTDALGTKSNRPHFRGPRGAPRLASVPPPFTLVYPPPGGV